MNSFSSITPPGREREMEVGENDDTRCVEIFLRRSGATREYETRESPTSTIYFSHFISSSRVTPQMTK